MIPVSNSTLAAHKTQEGRADWLPKLSIASKLLIASTVSAIIKVLAMHKGFWNIWLFRQWVSYSSEQILLSHEQIWMCQLCKVPYLCGKIWHWPLWASNLSQQALFHLLRWDAKPCLQGIVDFFHRFSFLQMWAGSSWPPLSCSSVLFPVLVLLCNICKELHKYLHFALLVRVGSLA